MKTSLMIFLPLLFTLVAAAETMPEGKLSQQQLTYESGRQAFSFISRHLRHYQDLTDLLDQKTKFRMDLREKLQGNIKEKQYTCMLSLSEFSRYGTDLEWDMQTIGLNNALLQLEGTMLRQQADLLRLKYQLAQFQQVSKSEITKLRAALSAAEKQLAEFLNKRRMSD